MRVNHKSTQHYDGYDEYKLEVLDKRKVRGIKCYEEVCVCVCACV